MKKLIILLFGAILSFNANAQQKVKSEKDLCGTWKKSNSNIIHFGQNENGEYEGTLIYFDPNNDLVCSWIGEIKWENFDPPYKIDVRKQNCDHPAGYFKTVSFYSSDYNTISIEGVEYHRQ